MWVHGPQNFTARRRMPTPPLGYSWHRVGKASKQVCWHPAYKHDHAIKRRHAIDDGVLIQYNTQFTRYNYGIIPQLIILLSLKLVSPIISIDKFASTIRWSESTPQLLPSHNKHAVRMLQFLDVSPETNCSPMRGTQKPSRSIHSSIMNTIQWFSMGKHIWN